MDNLDRPAIYSADRGAENFMALGEGVERRFERENIQIAGDAERGGKVRGAIARFHLLNEPKAFLRE